MKVEEEFLFNDTCLLLLSSSRRRRHQFFRSSVCPRSGCSDVWQLKVVHIRLSGREVQLRPGETVALHTIHKKRKKAAPPPDLEKDIPGKDRGGKESQVELGRSEWTESRKIMPSRPTARVGGRTRHCSGRGGGESGRDVQPHSIRGSSEPERLWRQLSGKKALLTPSPPSSSARAVMQKLRRSALPLLPSSKAQTRPSSPSAPGLFSDL